MNRDCAAAPAGLISTGIGGLDDILAGGLPPGRLYLVEGDPGSGKTTLALQVLRAGVANGEKCLFITLSESPEELRAAARSHGWNLEGIDVIEVIPTDESLKPEARYTMFHSADVELGETTRRVLGEIETRKPSRVVFDSLSEMRLLAQSPLRYRREILQLKQTLTRNNATILLIDDKTSEGADLHLHSIAHGVISLERQSPAYGIMRRRLQIRKLRGRDFRSGYHDFQIRRGGLEVYPRLIAAEHKTSYARESIKSGVSGLDALLGGGLARGTSNLILGPAGTGKSTIAAQYALAAARDGQHAVIYLFDESIATFRERARGLGMKLDPFIESEALTLRQVDPVELSPGEFTHLVRYSAENSGSRIVVIDSLNGYLNAMPDERHLTLHLHELLTYLGQQGITTILLMAQHGLLGAAEAPVDASYLADTVMLMRYFEAAGEVRQAVSVIKKRTGAHERTIRELRFSRDGLIVGDPIRDFRGILGGSAAYVGDQSSRGSDGARPRPN
jgi:circadian clock protein KaiC